ncbi:MAG: CRISPR-associated protein Cas4 [Chloroflexi bacterium]|nr:CRISPR-associated protein Cas4 [Chloroflexota bacterium]
MERVEGRGRRVEGGGYRVEGTRSPLNPPPSTLYPILTVTDLKQFGYCQRILYFTYCMPVKRPTTYKMEEGKLAHQRVEDLEARRSLKSYRLDEEGGPRERQFNVRLYSERLGLSGLLDMVITSREEVIPVDFKNSPGLPGLNHKYQLTAYALLVEDKWDKPVRRGFIHAIPTKRSHEITITPSMRGFVRDAMVAIRQMVAAETMPAATRHKGRCVDCEFLRFCNDRG